MTKVSVSLLAANPLYIGEAVRDMEKAGVDWLHVDVMDGHFVPNLNFGPAIVTALKKETRLPLDVHLMMDNPGEHLDAFIKAGSDLITIHQEIAEDVPALLKRIRAAGVKPGISVKPDTPVDTVLPLLDLVDMVLVMTVHPGFGGQKMIADALQKLAVLRESAKGLGRELYLQVDGGISADNAHLATEQGANVLVVGSALVGIADPAAALEKMHAL